MLAIPYINYPGAIANAVADLIKINPAMCSLLWKGFGVFFGIMICVLAINNFRKSQSGQLRGMQSPVLFMAFAIIGIIVLRLPLLVLEAQNVDENLMIVNAGNYLSGAVLWKDLSSLTHGPLLFMPLSIMYYLGDGINYASIRTFGLVFCLLPSLICMYLLFRKLFNSAIASLLLIPLIAFFAFSSYYDIIAYNSEYVPMIMIAFCLLILFSLQRNNQISVSALVLIGLIVGLFPYAKLQAMPIAFAIALCVLAEIVLRKGIPKLDIFKDILWFIVSAIVPSLIFILYLYKHDAITDFWRDYILQNLYYTSHGTRSVVNGSARLWIMWKMIQATYDTKWLFRNLTIMIVFVFIIMIVRKQSPAIIKNRHFIYLLLITFFSYIAVSIPGNFFEHYQMLFVIPFAALTGYLFGSMMLLNRNVLLAKPLVTAAIFILLLIPFKAILFKNNPGIQFIKDGGNYQLAKMSLEIKSYTKQNERMAVWGWQDKLFIETGLLPAKCAYPFYEIIIPEVNNYLERYVTYLDNNKPIVFVDAVSPYTFYFHDRQTQGHENYPLLNAFVIKNYQLVDEIGQVRVYVLNNRLAELGKGHI